jgi:hypothetical protein
MRIFAGKTVPQSALVRAAHKPVRRAVTQLLYHSAGGIAIFSPFFNFGQDPDVTVQGFNRNHLPVGTSKRRDISVSCPELAKGIISGSAGLFGSRNVLEAT